VAVHIFFKVDECGLVVVAVEGFLFDQQVIGSILALCCFVFYLLINSKFEFLAKIGKGQIRTHDL
jgi:hypothetical protein